MHLIEIDAEVFHLTLHVFILDADLHDLGMLVTRVFPDRFEHLAIEDRRATRAAILRKQARAVDVDPVRAAQLKQQGQPSKRESRPRVFCRAAEMSG